MLMFTSFMLTMLTIIFVYLHHPLFMALSLVTQSSILALALSIPSTTPWFSFILLMLFVSGMMIIFVYTASVASNEITPPYQPRLLMLSLFATLVMWAPLMFTTSSTKSYMNLMSHTYTLTYKPYNSTWVYFTTFLILYLLVVLILAIKITSLSNKPLRA
uniref:NADH dehydrogenase subunit 6 n=1 Tax=Pseudocrangonyx joolaei TaxID=2558326 RepID=A0A7L7TB43_9CRUS|nr:NADH dehydrogenase subunit 6 [Pseudocrangonyx joolaei]QOC70580.1 NADH dehydrogenase subunit 6 [Pseudocrangonyx joolaei]